jgi:DNA repair protein RadC
LDQRNRVIDVEMVEHGIENRAHIYIKRVVQLCLDRNATAMICVHNHPSGSEEFSLQDVKLTEKLFAVLKDIEIRFLDHLLIANNETVSMLDTGIFNFK